MTIDQDGNVSLGARNEATVNRVRKLYWKNPLAIEVIIFTGGWDPGPPKQKTTVGTAMRHDLVHSQPPIPLYQTAIIGPNDAPLDTIEEIDRAQEIIKSYQEGLVTKNNTTIKSVCLGSRAIGIMWYWLWRGKLHIPYVAWDWSSWWDWGIESLLLPLRLLDPTGWAPWTKWTRKKRGGR